MIVELAQNAADAALRAGVPGRLRLALRDGTLTAANTGTPLDAAGVEALSTLRASAKRDEPESAGRFGVGFAAVVAITDHPEIITLLPDGRSGAGVGWSAARARELVSEVPGLAEELGRRAGGVPVLRLPFPVEGEVPAGFTSVVRLPLRDRAAEELVRGLLDQVGPALMLALPALRTVEIEVDGTARTLTAIHRDGVVEVGGTRWRTVEDHGELPAELLAGRPVEERARPFWRVRWAVPEGREERFGRRRGLPDGVPAVVHAPTPSDEPLDLPALLIATFPMAPDRRHVAPGPPAEYVAERAAESYVRLLRELPAGPDLLDLVPGAVAGGQVDAWIRRGVHARIPDAPLLPGPDGRIRGRDAAVADAPAALLELLGQGDDVVLPGLLPAGWPARHPALNALGVRGLAMADIVDLLAGLDRPPAWWRTLYGTLAGVEADALGALPVPLAGPRPGPVRGPRGLLIAADGVDPAALEEAGLRFVHPEAAHPLLLRLGAVEAGPRELLADPAVRAAAEAAYEDGGGDAAEIAHAVLALVAAARLAPGEEPWLAGLALPAADGEPRPAGELLLPGSPLRALMAEDAPFGVVADELVERYGPAVLAAAGVLDGFALVREKDVGLATLADSAGDAFELADEDLWAEEILERLSAAGPALVTEFTGVRDLELVADWERALPRLARPPLRAAVVEPVYVMDGRGGRIAAPSYTAWWLAGQPVLDGRRPGGYRLAGTDDLLAGLYDVAPADLDEEFLRALGVRTSLHDLLAEPGGAAELLARMADPARTIPRERLGTLWTALADAVREDRPDPPERVRALVDGEPEVVTAEDALVLDAPDLLPLLAGQPLVVAARGRAAALAWLLDLPRAAEEIPGVVESLGERRPVPAAVRSLLPAVPESYVAHERLVVDGRPVPWRIAEGVLHAAGPSGLARGLAWAADRWADRYIVEAALRDPDGLPHLITERDLEG